MSKTYVVQIDNGHIRSMRFENPVKVGQYIPDEVWIGQKVKGGFVKKVFNILEK